jgi:hypothetical protein
VDDAVEYRKLWLWVILAAQEEAAGVGGAPGWQRSWARRWLTTGTPSFYAVCSLAGFDREKATFLKEQESKRWKRK